MLSKRVENTLGKVEIARHEQFLLFPQCFQEACCPGASKGVIVWEWVNNVFQDSFNKILSQQLTHKRAYMYLWEMIQQWQVTAKVYLTEIDQVCFYSIAQLFYWETFGFLMFITIKYGEITIIEPVFVKRRLNPLHVTDDKILD